MNRSTVLSAFIDPSEKLDIESKNEDKVLLFRRYQQVKTAYGESYENAVIRYRLLVREIMISEYLANPLHAAFRLQENLDLEFPKDRDVTDLILCAGCDLCIQEGSPSIADAYARNFNTLH
ncbi:MAG: hypothetical protein DHS20C12_11680 [Pseudohongiella sp.]|nr:MAG: hypothetical protein DHS20C12_11680 [Pseudohongiella sp.]